ncbi:hypothetical protein [Micromonospora sp. CPCC 206061]|uniref:hypothetical protein n=1 Tax=Micromonospora sp. CPCC 206061 TaxID=3122410 RepID=UPI002FF2745B
MSQIWRVSLAGRIGALLVGVVAWAVQKSNAATWMNREVRADRVAAAIRAAAKKSARRRAS